MQSFNVDLDMFEDSSDERFYYGLFISIKRIGGKLARHTDISMF